MVIRCSVCKKIKKFGKWIEVPESLERDMKEVPMLIALCDDCRRASSEVKKPLNNNSGHKMVCI